MPNNFQRMLDLIGQVFDTRNDPEQLQVTDKDRKKLEQLHPSTLSEFADENGPAVWILLIPTTAAIMNDFIEGRISEQAVLDQTKVGGTFESVYLCSATVLPEYRGKGIAKKLTVEAINNIRKTHPLKALFVWPFTGEGDGLADTISKETGLPLYKRAHK
jgi:ribosomal protein S18 acetylase RimI-like enzyme